MLTRVLWGAMVVSMGVAVGTSSADRPIPREHHEWGRFPVGSWKKVRLVTEKLDREGNIFSRNSTITTTTVSKLHVDSVDLRVETSVELAGKQFAQAPQLVKQGFNGEVEAEDQPRAERLVKFNGREQIEIDGQRVESEVHTITVRRDDRRWTSRIHYCQNLAPYILRREITADDLEAGVTRYETSVEVIAVDMPYKVNGKMRPTSHIRTVHSTNKGKSITLEIRCEDVPGGFVSHTSKRLDADGNVIQRSTLELIEYHVPAPRPQANFVRPMSSNGQGTWYYRRWRTN